MRVVDVCCEPTGMNPTDAVKLGCILLEGKCLEAWVAWESRNSQIVMAKCHLVSTEKFISKLVGGRKLAVS